MTELSLLREALSSGAEHWHTLPPNAREAARSAMAALARAPETPLSARQICLETAYMIMTVRKAFAYIAAKWPTMFETDVIATHKKLKHAGASAGILRCTNIAQFKQLISLPTKPKEPKHETPAADHDSPAPKRVRRPRTKATTTKKGLLS